MANLNKTSLALLVSVVAATLSEAGYQFVAEKDATALVKGGFVEQNKEIVSDSGEFATRATQAGIDLANNQANVGNTSDVGMGLNAGAQSGATSPSAIFAVADGITMPGITRGGRSGGAYPFEKLELGQSFFVPATAAKPNPAKSMASTVTSANERFSEEIEGETRQNRKGKIVPATRQIREFAIRPVADGAAWGEQYAGVAGAGVWRTL